MSLINMNHISHIKDSKLNQNNQINKKGVTGVVCETYFPLRSAPPLNPHSNIMCLCLIPDHYLHVILKEGCPLPPSCMEWNNNKIGEAENWNFQFLDRQAAFNELLSKEPKPPKRPMNERNPIICDNTPTPQKKEQVFEVMEEEEDLGMSLDFLDSL